MWVQTKLINNGGGGGGGEVFCPGVLLTPLGKQAFGSVRDGHRSVQM